MRRAGRTRRSGSFLASAAALAAAGAGLLTAAVDVSADTDNAWAWGRNDSSQIGDGTTQERDVPVQVHLPAGVRAITGSIGSTGEVVVDDQGGVWTWGSGRVLGNGTVDDAVASASPVHALFPAGVRIEQVAEGDGMVVALDGAGTLWEWGFCASFPADQATTGPSTVHGAPVRIPTPTGIRFTSVSAGVYEEAIAVDSDGNAWTWGMNPQGALGTGLTDDPIGVPTRVVMPAGVSFTTAQAGGVGGGAGEESFVALDRSGQAWAWGDNAAGSVGNGSTGGAVITPTRVVMPAGVTRFTAIAVGGGFTEALDPSGHIWGWGNNGGGQLGIADPGRIGGFPGGGAGLTGSAVEAEPPAGITFTSIVAGAGYSVALDRSGDAWSWGSGAGTLGNGVDGNGQQFSLIPIRASMPNGIHFTRLIGGASATSVSALTGDLTVAPPSQPAPTGSITASTIALSLVTPLVAFGSPQLVVAGTIIALVATVFTTFPGTLFNLTLQENDEALRRWFAARVSRPRSLLGRLRRQRRARVAEGRRRGVVEFGIVLVAGSLLASLNDPTIGFDPRSATTVGSVFTSLLVGTLIATTATWAYHRARFRDASMRIQAIPVGLLVAAASVLVSRVTSFQPGYLYGVIAGVVFTRTLKRDEKGHVALAVCASTIAVAIVAWIGTAVLSDRAHAANPALGIVFADNVLATLFVGGLVGTLLNLLPLEFLPGGSVKAWRVDVWGVAFAACVLLLVNVLLFHGSLSANAPIYTTLALFAVFGVTSIVVRDLSLQRQRRARGVASPSLRRRLRELTIPVKALFDEAP